MSAFSTTKILAGLLVILALGVGLGVGLALNRSEPDGAAGGEPRSEATETRFEDYGGGCASCDARHQRLKQRAQERESERESTD